MNEIFALLFDHGGLSTDQARGLLLDMASGKIPDVQLAALLAVYRMRAVTVDELLGFREALMDTRVPVDFSGYRTIDIVGTGGDGKNTFNISTCACFVVAGAGYKVAKHGNYGASSVSGASNVMEQHGVKFTSDSDKLRRCLDECNIAYLHAQLFSPAMKVAGPVRRTLGMKTVFNLLGPLVNPCNPSCQLLGVADLSQMRLYANVFYKLGIDFSVVSSLDGYDEISLTDDFKIMGNRYEHIFSPSDIGFEKAAPSELYGGRTKEEAAEIFDNVLAGRATRSQRQCVVATAGVAIHTLDPDRSLRDCLGLAAESLDSGRAAAMFRRFVEIMS